MNRLLLPAYLLLLTFASHAQVVQMKGANISLAAGVNKDGLFQYAVQYRNQTIISPSALGLGLQPHGYLTNFRLLGVDSSSFTETWAPVWGEEDSILNKYKQLTFHLQQDRVKVDIIFRIFNDGIGFRYFFPEQEALRHFILQEELTGFALAGDHMAFWIPGDYETNEYTYNHTRLSAIDAFVAGEKEKDIAITKRFNQYAVQTPLMMKTDDGLYINIHEAALVNYPAMQLRYSKARNIFYSELVPDAVGNKAYLQAPFATPWRTIVVSNRAEDILASRTILNLNEPSAIQNTDWIKPQKFVGMWWEMHIGKANWPLAGGKHGANTANVKSYIDFAGKHGFDGVLVEGWNQGWEDWFGNWKEEVFDFVTPYPDYDIDELIRYAKEKNVKLIMHHETSGSVTNYERRMDTAFRYMVNHGINTVKTGYVGRIIPRGEHHDSQWMINHYNRVAAKAASYGIIVDSHESVRPTGLHRTWPNWMASEAARGTEFNNAPTLGITADHNTILPFTRMMGGPMDYTPGLFHMKLNQFDSSRKTVVRSTLAKQLALYITMYSPLQMAADLPENYNAHLDAFQFIKDVPVNWSETRIIAAEPGEHILIARRAKNRPDWFIGGITNQNSRTHTVKLDFLEAGKSYKARIYMDAPDADYIHNPEAYRIMEKTVKKGDTLTTRLAFGGGWAASIIMQPSTK